MPTRVVMLALTDDACASLDRIAQAFARRYGAGQVAVYQGAIGDVSLLTSCQVAIVVIGPRWLAALRDAERRAGSPRPNDHPQDLLVQVLRSPTLVVPLLIDGAQMPAAVDLPPALAPLADRHALVVRPARGFARDTRRVVRHVAIQLEQRHVHPLVVWGSITLCICVPFGVAAAAIVSNLVVLAPLALAVLGITAPVIAQARRQRYWTWASGLTLLTGVVIGVVVLLTLALIQSGGDTGMWRAVLAATLAVTGAWSLALVRYADAFNTLRWDLAPRGPKAASAPARAPASVPPDAATATYFLSYRREDSSAACQRIYRMLERAYPRDSVYRDLDMNLGGADFRTVLARTLSRCEVVLAIIGPHWLDLRDTTGQRRLEQADDFVRLELATALRLGKIVVPVLVDGAARPTTGLPTDLAALAGLRAFRVRTNSWLWLDLWPVRWSIARQLNRRRRRRLVLLSTGVALYAGLGAVLLVASHRDGLLAARLAEGTLAVLMLAWCGALGLALRERLWGWCGWLVGLLMALALGLTATFAPFATHGAVSSRWTPIGALLALLTYAALAGALLLMGLGVHTGRFVSRSQRPHSASHTGRSAADEPDRAV